MKLRIDVYCLMISKKKTRIEITRDSNYRFNNLSKTIVLPTKIDSSLLENRLNEFLTIPRYYYVAMTSTLATVQSSSSI